MTHLSSNNKNKRITNNHQRFSVVELNINMLANQEKKKWFSTSVTKTLSDKDQFEVTQILANIDCFDFNIFELDKILQNRILYYLANSIFISMEIDYLLQSDKWISFITAIIKGYGRDTIRYHNDIHAANVFQTSYALLKKGDLKNKLKLTDLDVFSFLLATICHDFKHTGFSNNYLINLKHSIAITYNGKILY